MFSGIDGEGASSSGEVGPTKEESRVAGMSLEALVCGCSSSSVVVQIQKTVHFRVADVCEDDLEDQIRRSR